MNWLVQSGSQHRILLFSFIFLIKMVKVPVNVENIFLIKFGEPVNKWEPLCSNDGLKNEILKSSKNLNHFCAYELKSVHVWPLNHSPLNPQRIQLPTSKKKRKKKRVHARIYTHHLTVDNDVMGPVGHTIQLTTNYKTEIFCTIWV